MEKVKKEVADSEEEMVLVKKDLVEEEVKEEDQDLVKV